MTSTLLPYSSQEKKDLSISLACCIVRAKRVSCHGPDPENEVYWYTREACYPVSRRLGLLWSWVMLEMRSFDSASIRDVEIETLSAPFWLEVVHPDVIAREVMES